MTVFFWGFSIPASQEIFRSLLATFHSPLIAYGVLRHRPPPPDMSTNSMESAVAAVKMRSSR